jgi:hypothetical protein
MTNAERLEDLIALLSEMADSVHECISRLDDFRRLLAARRALSSAELTHVARVLAVIAKGCRDAAHSSKELPSAAASFDGEAAARALDSSVVALQAAVRLLDVREGLGAVAQLDAACDVLQVVAQRCRDGATMLAR